MFDEKLALKMLVEDRNTYIKRAIEFAQGFLDRGMDEAAAMTIMTAGDCLRELEGTMEYVKQLQGFNENGYPRYVPIFD